jgi:hypothetical protein
MTYSLCENLNLNLARAKACKVAYAINNRQIVGCSIIGDQPLFYMDVEEELDEAFGADTEFFDFTAIESGVEALSEKIESFSQGDELHIGSMENTSDRHADFISDMALVCGESPYPETMSVEDLLQELSKSRLGAAFIEFARSYDTKIVYDNHTETVQYDRNSKVIMINPRLAREDKMLLTVRELRRVWQHRNGAMLNPLTFHPDQAVLINRAQIADLSVMMVRVGWELQLSGDKEIWARLEHSSLADLTRSFARESYLDFRTLNSGAAQSAVFESWFLSERCRHADRKLIQLMLADYQGHVFASEATSQSVSAELLIALGTMPFGKNYLAPYIGTLMEDAIFTEIRDRANANFLWFIKFERTFRETERDLQTSSSNKDRSSSGSKENQQRFGDHEKETDIITLPFAARDTFAPASDQNQDQPEATTRKLQPQSGDNVLSFPQDSGKHGNGGL